MSLRPAAAKERFLEQPLSYRLWQAPFAERKFTPVRRHNDMSRVRRVLDVGCGPGTNTPHFAGIDYLGIDVNPSYVEYARQRHGRDFEVADATELTVPDGERFDFVLINSLLHHIAEADVRRLLSHLSTVLTPDGHIHILELVMPPNRSVARLLARLDRGFHPRPLREWSELLSESFDPVVFEPYALGGWSPPTTLWNMVYFKGSPIQDGGVP